MVKVCSQTSSFCNLANPTLMSFLYQCISRFDHLWQKPPQEPEPSIPEIITNGFQKICIRFIESYQTVLNKIDICIWQEPEPSIADKALHFLQYNLSIIQEVCQAFHFQINDFSLNWFWQQPELTFFDEVTLVITQLTA